MAEKGYVMIHRKLWDNPLFAPGERFDRRSAWLWILTSSDERYGRSQMVRGTEWAMAHKSAMRSQLISHRVNLRCLQRLVRGHWWQNRWYASCKHRLTRTWRANHYHIMPTCGRNLQCALDVHLSLYVGKILGILALLCLSLDCRLYGVYL